MRATDMEQSLSVHHSSPPEAKIALFRNLFRGREDVYSRRFVNWKTGRSGYAPACANEWLQGICEKPRIKCAGVITSDSFRSRTTWFVAIWPARPATGKVCHGRVSHAAR